MNLKKLLKHIIKKEHKTMENYLMLHGQKIELTEEQIEKIRLSHGFCQTPFRVNEGEVFKIGDIELIRFPEINGGVPVVAKDSIARMKFGESNNLKESTELQKGLDGFLKKITNVIGEENVLSFETDLLSLDGGDKYGKMTSKVSLPTLDFYRSNRKIFDKHKLDKYYWLATPDSNDNSLVLCVAPSGGISCYNNYYYDSGVRPFCILKSNIFVSE